MNARPIISCNLKELLVDVCHSHPCIAVLSFLFNKDIAQNQRN